MPCWGRWGIGWCQQKAVYIPARGRETNRDALRAPERANRPRSRDKPFAAKEKCRGRDSNPHGTFAPEDFKAAVVALARLGRHTRQRSQDPSVVARTEGRNLALKAAAESFACSASLDSAGSSKSCSSSRIM